MAADFGALLMQHRVAAGLSQAVLAAMADCHQTYVGQLERGVKEPSRVAVLAFARVFDLNVSQTDRLLHAAGLATQLDYQALYEAKHGLIDDQRKWCPRCERSLPAGPNGYFSTDRSRADGLFPYCRSCKSAAWTKYSTKVALRGQARRSA